MKMSKILITQALDERDLLVKKLRKKISDARFNDCIAPVDKTCRLSNYTKEEFEKQAISAYDQINDLIKRFDKIDAAIIESNANTKINISGYGEVSVAFAISLRNRITEKGKYDGDAAFERALATRMGACYYTASNNAGQLNSIVKNNGERMRDSILGKEKRTDLTAEIGVVDAYLKNNSVEILDPVDVKTEKDNLNDKIDTLAQELDTQIKIANATTYIEID